METCKGLSPGRTYGKRRIMAQAQRCGALPEPGHEHCAAHLRARGLRRCPRHGWVTPATGRTAIWCPLYPGCDHIFEKLRPLEELLAEMDQLRGRA